MYFQRDNEILGMAFTPASSRMQTDFKGFIQISGEESRNRYNKMSV
jgi:hypothetical protein